MTGAGPSLKALKNNGSRARPEGSKYQTRGDLPKTSTMIPNIETLDTLSLATYRTLGEIFEPPRDASKHHKVVPIYLVVAPEVIVTLYLEPLGYPDRVDDSLFSVLSVGLLRIRALVLGVYIGASEIWKLPYSMCYIPYTIYPMSIYTYMYIQIMTYIYTYTYTILGPLSLETAIHHVLYAIYHIL